MDMDMAANPFLEWFSEVAGDEVVSEPFNIFAEAHGNLWSFSVTSAQAAALRPAHVASFIRSVAEARSRQLSARGPKAMLFYCWHDEQAAQLRFSLVSAEHGRLPFARSIELAPDLESVVASFLNSRYHDGIPYGELRLAVGPEGEDDPDRALPVWVLPLPEDHA
jgi:hypothetical protein